MNTNYLQKMIIAYKKSFQVCFDDVFLELKKEFDNLKGNGGNDDFIRHIIKGWNKGENPKYRIHGHQRRMPDKSLMAGINALKGLNWKLSASSTTFEQLYQEICNWFNGIVFCQGLLTCYDVAMRIGQLFGIEPTDKVYLSCGALVGARRLLGKPQTHIIDKSSLPAPLSKERSIYIEDILCIFKDVFLPKNHPEYRSIDEILGILPSCHSRTKAKRPHGCC